MKDEKIVNLDDARKPVLIENRAAAVILSSLVIWLLQMHFHSIAPEVMNELFTEGRDRYCQMGLAREEVDQVMDFLEAKYNDWKKGEGK